jgi:hypothetical protein
MSLEQTLDTTNVLLSRLITILQTGLSAPAEIGAPADTTHAETTPKRTTTRAKKEVAAGTIYWLIPSMDSAFAQEPGMAAPTATDAVKVTQQEYEAKKAEISQRVDAVLAAQTKKASAPTEVSAAPSSPTAEVAADAAPTSTAASAGTAAQSAETAQPASTAAEVKYADVFAKFKELSGAEGHGRESVMKVLKQFLPNEAAPTVSKTEALGRNAEIVAVIDALLKPAAAEFDPLA